MSISGKVALVTGGASGIGLAVVKKLLQNDAKGVTIVDISETNGLRAVEEVAKIFGNHRVIFVKTDVAQEKDLRDAFDVTVKTYKNLDIVINNAGIVDEINWEKTIDILLVAVIRGTYLAMETYLPKYKSGSEGIIVNTSSICGVNMLYNTIPTYSISKRGVITLGEALGTEDYYNKYKTKILTICPGFVDTPILKNSKHKHIFEEKSKSDESHSRVLLTPEFVAQKYIDIIDKGSNGSIWVLDNDEPEYEIAFPYRKHMKK